MDCIFLYFEAICQVLLYFCPQCLESFPLRLSGLPPPPLSCSSFNFLLPPGLGLASVSWPSPQISIAVYSVSHILQFSFYTSLQSFEEMDEVGVDGLRLFPLAGFRLLLLPLYCWLWLVGLWTLLGVLIPCGLWWLWKCNQARHGWLGSFGCRWKRAPLWMNASWHMRRLAQVAFIMFMWIISTVGTLVWARCAKKSKRTLIIRKCCRVLYLKAMRQWKFLTFKDAKSICYWSKQIIKI